MSAAAELPTATLTGQEFLSDFRSAIDIAEEIGQFESWVLAGRALGNIVSCIKNNPTAAEQLSVGGLSSLLSSRNEKLRIEELVSTYEDLNLNRYLGQTVSVSSETRGRILTYSPANSWTGETHLPRMSARPKNRKEDISSIIPARKVFRIGEDRPMGLFRPFWEVQPFDANTGEPKVELRFEQ